MKYLSCTIYDRRKYKQLFMIWLHKHNEVCLIVGNEEICRNLMNFYKFQVIGICLGCSTANLKVFGIVSTLLLVLQKLINYHEWFSFICA